MNHLTNPQGCGYCGFSALKKTFRGTTLTSTLVPVFSSEDKSFFRLCMDLLYWTRQR